MPCRVSRDGVAGPRLSTVSLVEVVVKIAIMLDIERYELKQWRHEGPGSQFINKGKEHENPGPSCRSGVVRTPRSRVLGYEAEDLFACMNIDCGQLKSIQVD
jgi:hypothetical protein